jgi:hypothetical protein
MADLWREIMKDETLVAPAFALLKSTIDGYDLLTEGILNSKMQPPTPSQNDPNSNTAHHCLRLWSFGDDLADPLVSAFFFLRRRKSQGNADAYGLWAHCLTVGAKDRSAGGLTKNQLLDALNIVCGYVHDLDHAMKIEVMHLNTLTIHSQNLQDAFDQMHQNAQRPKRKPRFENKGTIRLGFPWVPKDAGGNEVFMDFVWLLVVPKY